MATQLITTNTLEPYFVDKDTGAPLTGGEVQFWKDSDRIVPKLVYQKVPVDVDPVTGEVVYGFVALPNPITLSAVGTIQDNNGNNIALYYFPYEGSPALADGTAENSTGVLELYYVAVFNSLGVEQFTREGWPFIGSGTGGGGGDGVSSNGNLLSNPQFVDVSFDQTLGISYSYTGAGSIDLAIAPDWVLSITHAGIGTILVNRLPIAGNANILTNPPYALQINPGANITSLILKQRMYHNPGIWTSANANLPQYIASFMLLGPGSQATMRYAPSVGAPVELLTGNNISAEYDSYATTVLLNPSANTDTSLTGYVDIQVVLSATAVTQITSLQILSLDTLVDEIGYSQVPVNRQIDHLFNYYNAQLQYKPIPSYLVGWDFGLNPGQLGKTFPPTAIGANNKSKYAWDQTIIFQATDNRIDINSHPTGGYQVTALGGASQFAMIQYLTIEDALTILNEKISAMVTAFTSVIGGMVGTISMYYSTDANLPDLAAPNFNSLVATLDANGKPATFNGNWVEVTRDSLGNAPAQFTVARNTDNLFTNYGFSQWAIGAGRTTANWFAIVVGFASLPENGNVVFKSISSNAGDIATIPAPQSSDAVLSECQAFYEKSFDTDIQPASNLGADTGEFLCNQVVGASTNNQLLGSVRYSTTKWADSFLITSYNPGAAGNEVRNETINANCTNVLLIANNFNGFSFSYTTAGGSGVGNINGLHWTADVRLGL